MMKRLTSLALILIIALTGCSFSPVDRSAGAQSADSDLPSQDPVTGWFYLETAVCVVNETGETVKIRFGTEKVPYNGREAVWYWDAVRKGSKNTGTVEVVPGKKVCSTSDDFPGITDSRVVFNIYFDSGAIARMAAENWASLTPAFFPTVEKVSDYSFDVSGTTHYSFNEGKVMKCETQEYDFFVYRLADSKKEKNWLVEIKGPIDPESEWSDDVCVKW